MMYKKKISCNNIQRRENPLYKFAQRRREVILMNDNKNDKYTEEASSSDKKNKNSNK